MDASIIVQAGGIAVADATVAKDLAKPYQAFTFTHPAMAGRTLVRLADESLSPAIDTEMSVLGFAEATPPRTIGQAQRRSLGFPAWALVHHPKDARFALAVMKDFRRAANQVKSKPGNAREAFAVIGKEFEAKAPAFLPSFWEEVGRVFLANENDTFAAASFEKARSAERTYKLPVDETRRAEVYLEFTLAGAVPAKSLTAYAADLVAAFGAAEAERRFVTLNVHRIRGGVAPYTSLPKELRKLAKDAARPPATADIEFLREVLDAPSLKKAPADFWTTYLDSLKLLAKSDEGMKRAIVSLFPTPKTLAKFIPAWLTFLVEIDALAMVATWTPAEASAWLTALTQFATRFDGWRRPALALPAPYLVLLGGIAPLLAATKTPVELRSHPRYPNESPVYHFDIVEAALDLGLVAEPGEGSTFDVQLFTRDPVRISRLEAWGPALAKTAREAIGDLNFEGLAAGKQGLVAARREAYLKVAASLGGALPRFESGLAETTKRIRKAALDEFPEVRAALAKAHVGPALHKTLRAGVLDEFSWPAWEKELEGSTGDTAECHGTVRFPVLLQGTRVSVFHGANLLRHYDLPAIGKNTSIQKITGIVYICGTPESPMDGDLLVGFRGADYSEKAFWISNPRNILDTAVNDHSPVLDCPLPDGRVTLGGAPMRPGDGKLETDTDLVQDNDGLYRISYEKGVLKCHEVDAATMKTGRAAWPAFVREATETAKIVKVFVAKAAPGWETSPYGYKDGCVGYFSTKTSSEGARATFESRQIGGLTSTAHEEGIRMPGAAVAIPVTANRAWYPTTNQDIQFGTDEEPLSTFGPKGYPQFAFRRVPRSAWFHAFVPRNLDVSVKLRALNEGDAALLVTAAQVDAAEAAKLPEGQRHSATATYAAVAKVFGLVATHTDTAPLAHALVMIARRAAKAQKGLEDLLGGIEKTVNESPDHPDRAVIAAVPFDLGTSYSGTSLAATLTAVASAFGLSGSGLALDSPLPLVPATRLPWEPFLGVLPRALAFVLTRPEAAVARRACTCGKVHANELRKVLGTIVEALAPFEGRSFHYARLQVPVNSPWVKDSVARFVRLADGTIAYASRRQDGYSAPVDLILFAPYVEGRALAVPSEATGEVHRVEVPHDVAFLRDLLTAFDTRDGVSMAPPDAMTAATTGLALLPADATLMYAGCPNFGTYASDFLGAEGRERLGLKMREASTARDRLRTLFRDIPATLALFADATRVERAEDLWGPAGFTAFEGALRKHFGAQVVVPEELVALCTKHVPIRYKLRELLAAFRTPASPMLASSAFRHTKFEAPPAYKGALPHLIDITLLSNVASLAASLPYLVPTGDPFLHAVGPVLRGVREILGPGSFVLPSTGVWNDEVAKTEAAFAALPGVEIELTDAKMKDDGATIAVWRKHAIQIYLRMDLLTSDPERARALMADKNLAEIALFVLGDGAAKLCDRVDEATKSPGGYEANPMYSAKEVVAETAAREGVSSEAAALYLQTLALPSPTTKWVCTLNGWSPATYAKAAQELLEKGLVSEGKRDRAGRTHFLPGEWNARCAVEAWKEPLYLRSGDLFYSLRLPGDLFAAVNERLKAGDRPRFLEAVREKPQKKNTKKDQ